MKELDVRYMIFGKEVGSEGTQHLQGYFYLRKKKSWSATIKYVNIPRAHIEIARGNSLQNRNYCSKDNDIFEKGDRPLCQQEKGEKGKEFWRDIIEASEKGDFGKIKEDAPQTYFQHIKTIQYHRTIAAVKPKSLRTLTNVWLWGKTGTGKSLSADLKYPNAYWKDPTNKWWDGYADEDVVILDDLDKKKAQDYMGHYLKTWAQERPFLAECKGGNTRYIQPKTFVVTCNWRAREIWTEEQVLEPIERRFQEKEILGNRLAILKEQVKLRDNA